MNILRKVPHPNADIHRATLRRQKEIVRRLNAANPTPLVETPKRRVSERWVYGENGTKERVK